MVGCDRVSTSSSRFKPQGGVEIRRRCRPVLINSRAHKHYTRSWNRAANGIKDIAFAH
jgi:hypothetical protein